MCRWPTMTQRARARRAGAEILPGTPAAGARSGKVARAARSRWSTQTWRVGPSHRAWSGVDRATTGPCRRDLGPADGPARPRASRGRARCGSGNSSRWPQARYSPSRCVWPSLQRFTWRQQAQPASLMETGSFTSRMSLRIRATGVCVSHLEQPWGGFRDLISRGASTPRTFARYLFSTTSTRFWSKQWPESNRRSIPLPSPGKEPAASCN